MFYANFDIVCVFIVKPHLNGATNVRITSLNWKEGFLSREQNEFLHSLAIYLSPATASPFHSQFNKVIPFI